MCTSSLRGAVTASATSVSSAASRRLWSLRHMSMHSWWAARIDAPLTYRDIGTYHDEVTMWQGRPVIRRRRYERLWREGDVAALSAY